MGSLVKKYSLALAITWTAVIFLLCSTPGRYIPTTSWLELISFDKFVHATMFFILQYLYMLAFDNRHRNLLIFILCVSYGGVLELMQATVFSQRSADWFDFIANSFGCIMAMVFFRKIKRKLFSNPLV